MFKYRYLPLPSDNRRHRLAHVQNKPHCTDCTDSGQQLHHTNIVAANHPLITQKKPTNKAGVANVASSYVQNEMA
jgi:hypothetical protein